MKSLADKLRIAKQRTKFWAMGIEVKWPQEDDLEESVPEGRNFSNQSKNERHRTAPDE